MDSLRYEAERHLIASILAPEGDYSNTKVKASDFESEPIQAVFEAWKKCVNDGVEVSMVSIYDALGNEGMEIVGTELLQELFYEVNRGADASYYEDILVRESTRATLRDFLAEQLDALDNQADPFLVSDTVSSRLLEADVSKSEAVDVISLSAKIIDDIEHEKKRPRVETFYDLDKMFYGLEPTDLNIVAARPSMGKTAFAMKLALLAMESGKRVDLWSLEMSAEQLLERMMQCYTQTSSFGLSNIDKAVEAAEFISDSGLLRIFDSATSTVGDIAAMTKTGNPDIVIVDYLQLMDGEGDNREGVVSGISRGLKTRVAKNCNCSVICLSQLNRKVEERSDKRPMLSDLRESGAIEQDADKIIFLYRENYYINDDKSAPGTLEVIVGKNRRGPCGTARLYYDPACNLFSAMRF